MFRDDADAVASMADHARWKNGRRFQSHDSATSWAAEQVRIQGPTRALTAARAMRDNAPDGSTARAYYGEAASLLESGVLLAGGAAW